MIRVPPELEGARLNLSRTAELFHMDPGHLRRLCRRGVLPPPKRTGKGMPYYDYELLTMIGEVLRTGIGLNQEEISFYRKKPKPSQKRRTRAKGSKKQAAGSFTAALIEGCKELGIAKDKLDVSTVKIIITEEFGDEKPELNDAIPVVARRILAEER